MARVKNHQSSTHDANLHEKQMKGICNSQTWRYTKNIVLTVSRQDCCFLEEYAFLINTWEMKHARQTPKGAWHIFQNPLINLGA